MVLDRATVGSGGSGKSSGIVRCHYGIRSLAAMAWHALPVLAHAREILGADSGYHNTGYLVGVGPENLGALRANVAMHRSLGIEVELVGHDTAQEMWPCGEPGRLRGVRLRAARWLRRWSSTAQAFSVGCPAGRGPNSPGERGGGDRAER